MRVRRLQGGTLTRAETLLALAAAYVRRRRRDNVTYSAARQRTMSVIPGNEREREQRGGSQDTRRVP